ncbi:MAG: aspartyl/asparaginyl beta-hydroxylase domain-containing protein [Crocinitomicaceae bacterium]|nr:aspartyl/asparaginyl beta-hydroxylase domain-containing protein [Crocinitomicaceae bacterium]
MQTTPLEQDRIILPFKFDPQRLLEEVKLLIGFNFEYYNCIQLRGPAHIMDTSLPLPPPAEDYADGSWTEWMNSPDLDKTPYLKSVIDTFREHTSVTLVRLLRLAPNSVIAEHTDPTLGLEVEKSVVRLTVPIQNNDDVKFLLNGVEVGMKNGECWYLRLTDPHEVINGGGTERINLTIDMIPNEWIRGIIAKAEG